MAKQRKTRQSDFIAEWEQLIATLTANAADLPDLEARRNKLRDFLEEARSLMQEQDLHDANKQASTRRLDTLMAAGKKVATFLRTGIKEHYGNRSTKLVEFGIQPFRRGKSSETEPPVEPPEPETPPVE